MGLSVSRLARFFRAGALRRLRGLLEITGSVPVAHASGYLNNINSQKVAAI
jgi:hypothetical protein